MSDPVLDLGSEYTEPPLEIAISLKKELGGGVTVSSTVTWTVCGLSHPRLTPPPSQETQTYSYHLSKPFRMQSALYVPITLYPFVKTALHIIIRFAVCRMRKESKHSWVLTLSLTGWYYFCDGHALSSTSPRNVSRVGSESSFLRRHDLIWGSYAANLSWVPCSECLSTRLTLQL